MSGLTNVLSIIICQLCWISLIWTSAVLWFVVKVNVPHLFFIWNHLCRSNLCLVNWQAIFGYFWAVISSLVTRMSVILLHKLIFTRTWLRCVRVFAIANLSVICLWRWSTLLRGWTFLQYSFTAVYLSHPLTSMQNYTEIVPVNLNPLDRCALLQKYSGIQVCRSSVVNK